MDKFKGNGFHSARLNILYDHNMRTRSRQARLNSSSRTNRLRSYPATKPPSVKYSFAVFLGLCFMCICWDLKGHQPRPLIDQNDAGSDAVHTLHVHKHTNHSAVYSPKTNTPRARILSVKKPVASHQHNKATNVPGHLSY